MGWTARILPFWWHAVGVPQHSTQGDPGLDLRDYLRLIRRNWILIIASTLAGILVSGAVSVLVQTDLHCRNTIVCRHSELRIRSRPTAGKQLQPGACSVLRKDCRISRCASARHRFARTRSNGRRTCKKCCGHNRDEHGTHQHRGVGHICCSSRRNVAGCCRQPHQSG